MIQRVIAITVALVLVVGGGVFAYRQLIPSPEKEATGPRYATVPVRRGDIAVGVTARGILQPSQGGGLHVPWPRGPFFGGPPPDQFTVLEVLVQEGDYVRQGDPVIRLDASQLQSSIDQVRNDLEQKLQNLADRLGIPVSELSSVNPARGITLRAPISGRVTLLTVAQDGKDVKVAPGVSVRQGTPVARVVQDTRWVMTASLVPAEFRRLKVGDRVLARFAGFEGFVEATITEINPNAVPVKESELGACRGAGLGGGEEPTDRVVQVYRARIEGDNPGLILPGMEAQLALPNADGEAGGSWLLYCAKVEGYAEEETVVSTSDGIITQVFARDMQQVQAGDPLVALSGEATQRAIEQDLQAIRNLEMQLQSLQSFAGQLTVTAPMDGVVSELRVQPGQTISMGEWLGTIYNPGRMEMFVQVDDVDVLLIQQGAPVQITLDALPGRTFTGRVTWIAPSGQDQSGFTFFQVRIEVEGGPELRPGMQAQAFIDAGKAENVLLVPLEAIFQEDRQYKVEILKEDGTTEVVPVEVGLMNEFMAEIKSGLEEGQLVVVGSSADLLPAREAPDSLLPGPSGDGSGGGSGGGRAEPAPVPEPSPVPAEPGGGEGGG